MKLLNTIQNIIKEAEEQYNNACDSCVPVEELDRLEKHYKDSLKLLKLYQSEEKKEQFKKGKNLNGYNRIMEQYQELEQYITRK